MKVPLPMSTRSLTIVGAILLVSWLAWAGTPRTSPAPPVGSVAARPPIDNRIGREIAREADGLWDRLRTSPVPRQPTRNPFTFAAVTVNRARPEPIAAPPPPVEAAPEPTPAIEPPPPLKLQGIAEDGAGDAQVRTAIIAGMGKLFIVKVGDDVTARFTVAAIGPDVIELTDKAGGPPVRLALR